MTWTMDQCLPVEKIQGLEDFPYRFNDEDVPTYQLFTKKHYTNGTSELVSTSTFFYKEGGLFKCGRVRYDIVAVGYIELSRAGCTGAFDTHRVKLAATIEEAVENFNTFQKEVFQ